MMNLTAGGADPVPVKTAVCLQPLSTSDLSVVIPTFGREQVLVDTISALLTLETPPGAVLVIDQTEEHEAATVHALETWQDNGNIRWLTQRPPSIPKAMNRGLLEAQTSHVLFLDDDIVPDAQLVADHLAAWSSDEGAQAWCVVGQILQPGETLIDYGEWRQGWFPFNSDRRQFIGDVMAGNLCVDRQRALEVGGFDENFIGAAYRFESEFARRLMGAGGRILFAASARIDHLRCERGGTRAYGHHLRTWHPYHAVGKYYFGFTGGPGSALRTLLLQPLRAVRTRHHLARPWWIPASLVAELLGICWAAWLCWRGPRRLPITTPHAGE